MDKKRSRITIHWLPETYTVKVVVSAVTGNGNPEVFHIKNQEGRWNALCRPVRDIRNYAFVEVPGKKEEWHTIQITLPGCLTECWTCGEMSHWSNKCPNRFNKGRQSQKLSPTEFLFLGRGVGEKAAKTTGPAPEEPGELDEAKETRDEEETAVAPHRTEIAMPLKATAKGEEEGRKPEIKKP